MSVDTRTPRPGFDDQPPLSMLKVHSDPAQVIVNHASFRVKLATPSRTAPRLGGLADTARIPAMSDGAAAGAGAARRRTPVVWSGRSRPGDQAASGLLRAVRESGSGYGSGGYDTGATQVIPRVEVEDGTGLDRTTATPTVGGGSDGGPLLPPMRQAVGAYDVVGPAHGRDDEAFGGYDDEDGAVAERGSADARAGAHGRGQRSGDASDVRHAYFPGRRMNLGVVLLPLRVFLGFISIYAGMGKLCDPVYFDGGERGSMVKWLTSLHPWALAEPLRDFALSHPVGAGLSVAFLQVVAGVLTVLGLWQRVAAALGALLSAALLVTVSWKTVPAYDTPDFIYLAAWSPLVIAGAPVYSVDGRLASEAWRRLGPRSELWELRRYVLRRGTVVATVVIGLTLLVGSVLGGAVRSSGVVTVPGPNQPPVNQLPGEPLPGQSAKGRAASGSPSGSAPGARHSKAATPSASHSTGASAQQSVPGATEGANATETSGTTGRGEGASGLGQGAEDQAPTHSQEAPPTLGGGSSSTSGGTSGGSPSSTSSGAGSGTSGGAGEGGGSNPIGGLLG
jgi:uncharacterized membrane protein YphA (DoxX/SURF4 family)